MIATTHLCKADDSCLLVIDIQTRLSAVMPAKVLDRLKRNAVLLIKAAGTLSIPVLATQQYPQGLGPMEAQISEALPPDCRHFEKTCFSCAGADNFMQELGALGRKQIILAGIETHVCVLQTAIDLKNAGYVAFVVNDAVSSRQRDNYENALQRLRQAGVITCNTESVIFEWLRDARHEHFKTIAAMIE
ncbi:MAG: hydrolase [Gammaproteobacteria bacterium]